MVAGIAAASIIAYLAALLGMQKRQVYQQIVFLLIYIIGITALAEMDVVLPIYFLISLFPFLIRMEKMSFFSIIVYIYFGCYLLFGLLFQNTLATCITFIGKYWQFIIFFIVIDELPVFPYKRMVWYVLHQLHSLRSEEHTSEI